MDPCKISWNNPGFSASYAGRPGNYRGPSATILAPPNGEIDASKNEEAFAELIQFLDDKSLSLVMRDAVDDGRKALEILREHYAGTGKPRVISLYTELTSLVM